MYLQINFKAGLPIYLQIVDQVKAAASSGTLQPGEALPSIRNTIAKAYSELESQGVIETLPGRGCFVKENQSGLRKEIRRKLLIDEIDRAVVQAHHLQVPRTEFVKLVNERLDAIEEKRRANENKKEA